MAAVQAVAYVNKQYKDPSDAQLVLTAFTSRVDETTGKNVVNLIADDNNLVERDDALAGLTSKEALIAAANAVADVNSQYKDPSDTLLILVVYTSQVDETTGIIVRDRVHILLPEIINDKKYNGQLLGHVTQALQAAGAREAEAKRKAVSEDEESDSEAE